MLWYVWASSASVAPAATSCGWLPRVSTCAVATALTVGAVTLSMFARDGWAGRLGCGADTSAAATWFAAARRTARAGLEPIAVAACPAVARTVLGGDTTLP